MKIDDVRFESVAIRCPITLEYGDISVQCELETHTKGSHRFAIQDYPFGRFVHIYWGTTRDDD